jgi:single-strand DNA-binding protein
MGSARGRVEAAEEMESVNEVRLVGRLTAEARERDLPSGDRILLFRLVTDRPPERGRGARGSDGVRRVDAIECVAWRADVRRRMSTAAVGTWWEVQGVLRRRFWRGAAGPASRMEVEVQRVTRAA